MAWGTSGFPILRLIQENIMSNTLNSTYQFQPYGKYNFKPGEIVSVFSDVKELNGFAEFIKEEKEMIHLKINDQTFVKEKKALILEKTN